MAVAVKSGGFAMLLRVLLTAFGDPTVDVVGERLAAGRRDAGGADDDGGQPHRRAAGVGQAHARVLEHRARGVRLVGVTSRRCAPAEASGSVLFYLLAYTASTAGAFGALILCGSRGKRR
jgi:NADH-quinone oxidoreductase subunit N